MQALATAHSLERDDFAPFYEDARRVLAIQRERALACREPELTPAAIVAAHSFLIRGTNTPTALARATSASPLTPSAMLTPKRDASAPTWS